MSTTGDGISRVYNVGDVSAATAGQTGSGFQMDGFGAVLRFVSTATAPVPTPPHTLLNSATRMRVETGENVLIGGFLIRGGAKKVIIRAIGPSLQNSGVQGALADPILELHDNSGSVIFSNDDWVTSPQKQAISDIGIAPTNDKESAIIATLPEGTYTAVVAGVNGTSGVGLVEIYDLDRTATGRLVNLSTRGDVQTGENVMIGGVIIGGIENTRVIIRAIGPSLATGPAPVAAPLANPTLELRDAQGNLLEANGDWVNSPHKQEIIDSGIPPSNDKESAIISTLPPSNYTAIVSGVNSTTGVALVEVYNLQ